MEGSLKKVRAAAEAAGVPEHLIEKMLSNAESDHSFFGSESEAPANSRAQEAVQRLITAGISMGPDAHMTIVCELQHYFMS